MCPTWNMEEPHLNPTITPAGRCTFEGNKVQNRFEWSVTIRAIQKFLPLDKDSDANTYNGAKDCSASPISFTCHRRLIMKNPQTNLERIPLLCRGVITFLIHCLVSNEYTAFSTMLLYRSFWLGTVVKVVAGFATGNATLHCNQNVCILPLPLASTSSDRFAIHDSLPAFINRSAVA